MLARNELGSACRSSSEGVEQAAGASAADGVEGNGDEAAGADAEQGGAGALRGLVQGLQVCHRSFPLGNMFISRLLQ